MTTASGLQLSNHFLPVNDPNLFPSLHSTHCSSNGPESMACDVSFNIELKVTADLESIEKMAKSNFKETYKADLSRKY
jgi:hypothetical protein